MNKMNKIMHGVILAFFAFACWSVAIILKLPMMIAPRISHPLPAFTRLCSGLGPFVLAGLAVVAVVYCLFIWIRRAEKRPSWVSFLATAMAAVVLSMLWTVVAIYLPIVDFIDSLPRN